jgi:ribokinase
MARPRITVLGSLNTDISVSVPRLPGPGETVLGSAAIVAPGGKGANQAVATARLGAAVAIVGCVGSDAFGTGLLAALDAEGIDRSQVSVLDGVPTGIAMITVDGTGENMITVAPGANRETGAAQARVALSFAADMVLASAEVPLSALRSLVSGARAAGTPCLLNLAPAPQASEAAGLLAAGVDWLVVNSAEATAILGRPADRLTGAAAAAGQLCSLGAGHAVVTAGAGGAALAGPGGRQTVPGFPVRSVDAVGAGDAFVAALAVALSAGAGPAEALRAACAAGATATTRRGTQNALPRPADILAATGVAWPAYREDTGNA